MNTLGKHYEIVKEIGRGGMGIVYLAHDKRLDRKVAIKVLQMDPNLEESDRDKIVQRFYKEGRSLARLSHPNIVGIHDIGEDNGQYYMVMEFIEGKSLARLLQIKSPFAIDLVLTIATQITNALGYIHEKNILHRDVKPGNIMLSETGVAKLTDFGLAKLNDAKFSLTQTGSLFGSLMYIPPEQAMGAKSLDHRADIYSIGITLYELLTGVSPFQHDIIAVVVKKVIEEDPPPPSSLIADIMPELDDIILKAIKKNPNDRYQSAFEMEADLNIVLEKRLTQADSPSSNIITQEQLGDINTFSFSGKSEDNFLLSSVIQFLSLNNSSGRLSFWLNKTISSSIFINQGYLTHAELGKLTGIDAISHMFCWKYSRGEFEFKTDYKGEKLLYKSLNDVSIQKMIKSVTERLDNCPYRDYLHNKFIDINKKISIIDNKIPKELEKENGVKKQLIDKLLKNENLTLGELISNTHGKEIESCKAFVSLIDDGFVVTFSGLEKLVPYSHLLHVVNIISKYTDKSVALKFVSDKKSELNLSNANNTNTVSLKQLYKLSNMAFKEFHELLPEKESRWNNMKQQLRDYIESLAE